MSVPEQLKYTEDHEWIRIEEDVAVVGITDYAQSELGDIVFVELPAKGDSVSKGDAFGTIEAVKAVSDLFAPVTGEVIETNAALEDSPETVNGDPYGDGWMIKVRLADKGEADSLLDAAKYNEIVS